jgi:hypothetical protein
MAARYLFVNKSNGYSEYLTHAETMRLIDDFIIDNPTKRRLDTEQRKVTYYNKRSLYRLWEVQEQKV